MRCPLFLLPLLFLPGCASPGPPQPPSLHLPEEAKGVTARRVGDAVLISWTDSGSTTDGDRVKGSMTAVVCREVPPRGECLPVEKLAVVAGASSAVDRLSPDLAAGLPRLLLYRVEVQNARGRSAGASEPVFAAAGAAPSPVGPLELSARRNAVLVRWQPVPPSRAVMELKRTLVASADGSVGSSTKATAAAPARQASGVRSSPKLPAGEAILHGGAQSGAGATDGLLDPTVEDAADYIYIAQRVVNVTLSGHLLELRGEPSPPARFAFHDTLPPQAPTGLVAIPGEGFGAPLSVDLSWEPNAETDLLGYNVYRRTGQGEFRRLNAEPLATFAYRDAGVEAGRSYTYRITAVDRRGNESGAGVEVQETPRP